MERQTDRSSEDVEKGMRSRPGGLYVDMSTYILRPDADHPHVLAHTLRLFHLLREGERQATEMRERRGLGVGKRQRAEKDEK